MLNRVNYTDYKTVHALNASLEEFSKRGYENVTVRVPLSVPNYLINAIDFVFTCTEKERKLERIIFVTIDCGVESIKEDLNVSHHCYYPYKQTDFFTSVIYCMRKRKNHRAMGMTNHTSLILNNLAYHFEYICAITPATKGRIGSYLRSLFAECLPSTAFEAILKREQLYANDDFYNLSSNLARFNEMLNATIGLSITTPCYVTKRDEGYVAFTKDLDISRELNIDPEHQHEETDTSTTTTTSE